MIKAVFDANLLVSAFLSRANPAGASNALLGFVIGGAVELYLSVEIVDEAMEVLLDSPRYSGVAILTPEAFLRIARQQP